MFADHLATNRALVLPKSLTNDVEKVVLEIIVSGVGNL